MRATLRAYHERTVLRKVLPARETGTTGNFPGGAGGIFPPTSIDQLSKMRPGEELYDAKVTVLGEYVNHHVEEEQNEMFPKAKRAKVDTAELGKQIMGRKEQLQARSGKSGDGRYPAGRVSA